MPRLFTALEIPAATRTHLSLLRAPLGGAKWVEPDDMHITLRFVGDIDDRTADEFAALLAEIHAEPFPVTIQDMGSFGGRDPRVLWAGVEAGEPLARMDLVDPAARLRLDTDLLERFPVGYRHLAYLQTAIGYRVKPDMPGLQGPEVEALYACGRAWLAGEPLHA